VSQADPQYQQRYYGDSDDATRFKRQFVKLYRPLAQKYHLNVWSEYQL